MTTEVDRHPDRPTASVAILGPYPDIGAKMLGLAGRVALLRLLHDACERAMQACIVEAENAASASCLGSHPVDVAHTSDGAGLRDSPLRMVIGTLPSRRPDLLLRDVESVVGVVSRAVGVHVGLAPTLHIETISVIRTNQVFPQLDIRRSALTQVHKPIAQDQGRSLPFDPTQVHEVGDVGVGC